MNRSRHQLFAGSDFAEKQERFVSAAGDLLDLIENVIDPITLTNNVFMVVFQLDFFLKIRSLSFKLVLLTSLFRKGLLQRFVCLFPPLPVLL